MTTTVKKLPILLLDDEKDITNALYRLLRHDYQITCCNDPDQAQSLVAQNDYAVIICDMRMPKMDGASFLTIARQFRPDTVRVLLTGFADLQDTIRGINQGQIFSYISKPWNNDELKLAVKSACESYLLKQKVNKLNQELMVQNDQLQQINQQLVEQTEQLEQQVDERTKALQTSNKRLINAAKKQRQLFQNLLDIVHAIINDRVTIESGHNKRIAFQARLMAQSLDLDKSECTKIYLAALLADLGKVSLSDELISKPEHELNAKQTLDFRLHVLKGSELVNTLGSLGEVSAIIKHQFEYYSGNGFPDKLSREEIPIGSRILLILKDYDRLLLGLKYAQKYTPSQARHYLNSEADHHYDPKLVKLFLRLLATYRYDEHNGFDFAINSQHLQVGNVLAQDILYNNGNLFLTKETVITDMLLGKIRQYENTHKHNFTFYIY